ncbi:MAG TPA: hypothetical protein DCO86_00440 [Spirochaetaceae bacterium]|nr:hypothetical protein [Spirochaetaceae bacterium]
MNKIKILFVCHGNICRSPMAEAVMKKIAEDAGKSDMFEISSAAVSSEAAGCSVHPLANKMLKKHGISSFSHIACQMSTDDYSHYDRILVMDESNMRRVMTMTGNDPSGKISMLNEIEIDDPWYTNDFETAYEQIESGCKALFDNLMKELELKDASEGI